MTRFRAVRCFRFAATLIAAAFSWAPMQALAQEAAKPNAENQAVYRALLENAEKGDPEVQTALALVRMEGKIMPRDYKVARVWLGRAAQQGHLPAQYHLGQLLTLDVLGASQSELEAQLREGLGWLRRAAREQYKPAQLLYGQIVLQSDLEEPLGHAKREAEQLLVQCGGTDPACAGLALTLIKANRLTDQNLHTQRALLHTLANNDDPQAMYQLSELRGEDPVFWIRRASRLGHPVASFELADLALRNEISLLPQDLPILSLLDQAAQQGLPQAMHLLGTLLIEGQRFPVNRELGVEWLRLAAQAGYADSVELLQQIQP